MPNFHPTIISDKLVPTVNFYEDYFEFVPAIEKEGYTLLHKTGKHCERIEIFDASHKCVTGEQSVQGLILNIAVEDVRSKFDALYMEGLEMFKEFGTDIHGRDHFVVRDPNGVLVNVHQAVEVAALEAA